MLTLTLSLLTACAPTTIDDTADLGWEAEEKTPRLGGVTFEPPELWLPASPVSPVAVVAQGRAHVLASYCDDGIVIDAPAWVVDGAVLTAGLLPGYPVAPGDHTCTLVTPIGRLTIPVVVE